MPQPHRSKLLNPPLSNRSRENEASSWPDETAIRNLTPEDLSRLKRGCNHVSDETKASDKTLVDVRMNISGTSRSNTTAAKNPVDRQLEACRVLPLPNHPSARMTKGTSSTQSHFPRRNVVITPFGDCDKTILDRRQKRPDTRPADQFIPLRQIVYLWLKYRVTILISICSVVASVYHLDPSTLDNILKKSMSFSSRNASKLVKQQTPKTQNVAQAKATPQSAQKTTQVHKDSLNRPLLPEQQNVASTSLSIPGERIAVDLLIAGHLRAAHRYYCELALMRRDRPVYRVIVRTLSRQLAKGRVQPAPFGDDLCRIPEIARSQKAL